MEAKYIDVKEVALNNNCPECYSNEGLHIKFKQKIVETKFYKSISSEVKHEINCRTCNSTIYPVSWTDDLERVFNYHKKALEPMKASTYIKKTSWFAFIGILLIIALAIALVYYINL